MSEFLVNGYADSSVAEEATGKAEQTAALFTLLGPDCRENICTIVSQTRTILEADLSLYLTADLREPPVIDGWHPDGEALDRMRPSAMSMINDPADDGLMILDKDILPKPLDLDCRLIAGIPVMDGDEPAGLLMAGFRNARRFGPGDHHAARCLAGALSMQHRLKTDEQTRTTGLMARQVAHDLNNILAGLVSYPELILMQLEDDSPLKPPITLIHDSGVQAAEIIQDFLIMARPRNLLNAYPISPSASGSAFLQTAAYASLTQRFSQVRFAFCIEPDLPDIMGTEELLPRVLSALMLHSAQNLSGAGHVNVTMTESAPDPEEPTFLKGILLRVEDNGIKTDEKDLGHLFDPFYTKKAMGRRGSGLGLPAAQKLIQDQGGSIRYQSDPASGNRFEVFLPAC